MKEILASARPIASDPAHQKIAPTPLQDKVEILSVALLDQNRLVVEELKKLAQSLRLEFGWHYLLDLSWTIQNLGEVKGLSILEAGAGTGILQWYLAQAGAEVLSVDRMSRAALPMRFRNRFRVTGLRQADLYPAWRSLARDFTRPVDGPFYRRWGARSLALARDLTSYLPASRSPGSVVIYNQDLRSLVDLQDNSFDAVVSISALEHNSPEGLAQVVKEIMRVLKPGGVLLATLTARRDRDWWHEASSGWCYTDATLRRLFGLAEHAPSNYAQYDELFADLRNCAELRDNLARFYGRSDEKGMPKGVWNPEYQPVGVCRIKKVE